MTSSKQSVKRKAPRPVQVTFRVPPDVHARWRKILFDADSSFQEELMAAFVPHVEKLILKLERKQKGVA
jgi:hypothetical protein